MMRTTSQQKILTRSPDPYLIFTITLTPLESMEPGLALNFTVFRRARSFRSTLQSEDSHYGGLHPLPRNHHRVINDKLMYEMSMNDFLE
jgi:hypothetical protein